MLDLKPPALPVLVTGGRGFVGRHLVERLAGLGRGVVALDIGPRPEPTATDCPSVRHVTADVRDAAAMDEAVRGCSLVLHLAAVVGVDEYLARPEEVLEVGILGTRNVLEACVRHGRPVVLVSTSEIYGKNTDPLHESADAVIGPVDRPRWSYAISKLASEQWAAALARRGLRHLTVRYFNVYGHGLDAPGQGRVLAKMVGAVQRGEPLTLVDGGEAVRCFCHVDDAVEATLRLATELESGDRLLGRAFNVGRAEPVSMRALADLVVRLTGHRAGTRVVPGAQAFGAGFDEIPHRVPDVEALAEATGFRATIDLETGLRRTLAGYGLLAEGAASAAPPTQPVPWVRPFVEPDTALLARLRRSLVSGHLTNGGPLVREFEARVAGWLGVDDSVAVGSGTVALTLAALALGLEGRFILPSFTYAATASAFELLGLTPEFCEVDPETWTLCPEALARLLRGGRRYAAVVAVNAFGVPPDTAAIGALCREAGVPFVYDDAHGLGTSVGGVRVPPEPDVVTFSLHATKVLPAVEGGLVVARDPRLAAELRRLRTHGLAPDPLDSTPGPNAKLDELRAAVALHGLATLDATLARRRAYGARMRARASAHADTLRIQRLAPGVESSFQNFAVVVDAARGEIPDLAARLAESGVETRRYFFPALHRMRRFDGVRPDLPITDAIASRVLSLPLHARMTEPDLARVLAAIDALAEAHA